MKTVLSWAVEVCIKLSSFCLQGLGKGQHSFCSELRRWKKIGIVSLKSSIYIQEEIRIQDSVLQRQLMILASNVQFSHSVLSNSLRPHRLQHARPPCSSPTPGVYPNSCPLSQWCHPTISSSVVPFSSYLQSFSASGSFPMSQFFTSGGQVIGVSASTSVLLMNTQDWSPLGWTGWISL